MASGSVIRRVEQVQELARGEHRRDRPDEVEQVAVAGDQVVRVRGAGQRDQVVIVGVGGQSRLWGRVVVDHRVLREPGDELGRGLAADPAPEPRPLKHVAQLGQQRGLATSSKRSSTQAMTISRGAPAVEITAETSTFASGTTRTGALSTLGAPLTAHRLKLLVGDRQRRVGADGIAGLARLALQRGGDALAAAGQLKVALVGEHHGLGAPTRPDHDRFGIRARLAEALQQRRQLSTRTGRAGRRPRAGPGRPSFAPVRGAGEGGAGRSGRARDQRSVVMANTKQRASGAERAERRRQDRERLQRAAEQLLSSEGWQRWVRARSGNGLARYSLTNQLLVALQSDDRATFLAGFKQWLALGYCVKRGSRAIRIMASMSVKARDGQTGEETDERTTLFKTVAVFDRLPRVRSGDVADARGGLGCPPGSRCCSSARPGMWEGPGFRPARLAGTPRTEA
jgi:hypothetical protein